MSPSASRQGRLRAALAPPHHHQSPVNHSPRLGKEGSEQPLRSDHTRTVLRLNDVAAAFLIKSAWHLRVPRVSVGKAPSGLRGDATRGTTSTPLSFNRLRPAVWRLRTNYFPRRFGRCRQIFACPSRRHLLAQVAFATLQAPRQTRFLWFRISWSFPCWLFRVLNDREPLVFCLGYLGT